MRYLIKAFVAALLLCTTATLLAETLYVSDDLRITMRNGKSTRHNVIQTLTSGTAVEVLETDKSAGYTLIRLKNGKKGWALSRYLMRQPIARDRLASVQKNLTKTQEELAELKPISQQQALQIEALSQERDELAASLKQLRLQTADSVALIEKDERLQLEVATLTESNTTLRQRVDVLSGDQRLRWFMYGGGVMGIGILFGLILPKLRIQRKAWNEF
ncbi:MAG: TIGR04211 family SH3 domain-containing protein [Gammaproteobacteria bacterium]|nr:MAG: TIGR04211 family SH3 domain-containing protein [Gammaproteobacteria bacterium]